LSTPELLPQILVSNNNTQLRALLDSGCNLVLLSRLKAEKLCLKLNPSKIKVKAESGDHLRIIGETTVSILNGTRVFRMEVVVGDINTTWFFQAVSSRLLRLTNPKSLQF
jgi:hypothetical protein